MIRNIFIFLLVVFSTINIQAQADSLHIDTAPIAVKKFDAKKLNEYKKDKDFQYKEEKREETIIDKIIKWLLNKLRLLLEWLFGERRAEGVLKFIVKIFPYLIATIVVLLLLKMFLNIHTESIVSGKAGKSKINLSEDEEIIKSKNIEELIDKAIQNKDYRLAIRYHYLYTLQLLEKKEWIQWAQQKTNHDYEHEISDITLQHQFKDITYLYDFIWYGNFNIDKDDYTKAAKLFINITKQLS